MHQVWLHEEPGLAGAGTADYKDILVSCGFGVFRPVVHGEPFRLCQQNVVVKIGVDIGGYILGAAPSGAAVLHAFAVFLGVLAFAVHHEPQRRSTGDADQQVNGVETGGGTFKGRRAAVRKVQELLGKVDALRQPVRLPQLTALVSTYSVTAIAAYGVTGKLETILFYPAMALNMVLTTIIGQCAGGARYDRAKDYLKCALGYGCGLLVILSVLVVGFSKQLSGLFVRSSDVAVIVGTYFLIVSIGYVLNTVTNCYLGALNGMGKPSISMFLMIFYYIVVRMPLAYLLSYLGFGLNGIWVAVLVSHIVASLAATMTGTVLIRKKGNIKA